MNELKRKTLKTKINKKQLKTKNDGTKKIKKKMKLMKQKRNGNKNKN